MKALTLLAALIFMSLFVSCAHRYTGVPDQPLSPRQNIPR
jgi:hypothetical protein